MAFFRRDELLPDRAYFTQDDGRTTVIPLCAEACGDSRPGLTCDRWCDACGGRGYVWTVDWDFPGIDGSDLERALLAHFDETENERTWKP